MPKRRQDQGDFASTFIVALAVRALRAMDAGLLSGDAESPDPMQTATLEAADKRILLEHVYRRHGAGPLLLVGQHLHLADKTPTLSVLTHSSEPEVVAGKWMRLERYYHATNRTEIECPDSEQFICRRYKAKGTPSAAENALIAGLLVGACGAAGANDPALEIEGRTWLPETFRNIGDLPGKGAAFGISWRAWPESSCTPESPEKPSPGETLARLQQLLARDLGRSWRVGDAARELAKSARALQRELALEGRSFSTVLRGARIERAGSMLADTATGLAEIGYCCGYADQAHFHRDFRRVLNMTPAEYRRFSIA